MFLKQKSTAACRTAVGGIIEDSVVDQFSDLLDPTSTVNESDVRVEFDGEKRTDTELLKANNGKIMTKKIISFLLIIGFTIYCFYNPLVLQFENDDIVFKSINLNTNQLFKLRDFIKPINEKNLKAYIVINSEEFENLDSHVVKYKILKSDNNYLINDLLNCELKYMNADVATVQSMIYIYSDNKLIFKSGISLNTNSKGFQNNQLGWASVTNNQRFTTLLLVNLKNTIGQFY